MENARCGQNAASSRMRFPCCATQARARVSGRQPGWRHRRKKRQYVGAEFCDPRPNLPLTATVSTNRQGCIGINCCVSVTCSLCCTNEKSHLWLGQRHWMALWIFASRTSWYKIVKNSHLAAILTSFTVITNCGKFYRRSALCASRFILAIKYHFWIPQNLVSPFPVQTADGFCDVPRMDFTGSSRKRPSYKCILNVLKPMKDITPVGV